VVISGEVGLRKPDPAIYRLAADKLGLPRSAYVFVDDVAANPPATAELGMATVHHTGSAATVRELERLLGVDSGPPASGRPSAAALRNDASGAAVDRDRRSLAIAGASSPGVLPRPGQFQQGDGRGTLADHVDDKAPAAKGAQAVLPRVAGW